MNARKLLESMIEDISFHDLVWALGEKLKTVPEQMALPLSATATPPKSPLLKRRKKRMYVGKKLDRTKVAEIKRQLFPYRGVRVPEDRLLSLSEEFNVSKNMIDLIHRGKHWADVHPARHPMIQAQA